MAQLRNLGTPFGSPGGIINIPAPAGSALAGQIQMRAMEGLGQALGMYLGQRQAGQLRQEDIRRLQDMGPQQDILSSMYGARGMQAPQAQIPQMVGPQAQQKQLNLELGRLYGDPFEVQRTKAGLQTAQIEELGRPTPTAGQLQTARADDGTGLPEGTVYQSDPQGNIKIISEPEMLTLSEKRKKELIAAGLEPKAISALEKKLTQSQIAKNRVEIRALKQESGGILTDEDKRKVATIYRKEFDALSKDFRTVRDSYGRVLASTKDPSAAGDLALIFNFMKMLDPGSVVRESEFANAAASGSLGQRWIATGRKLLAGERLSAQMRADFLDRSQRLFKSQENIQRTLIKRYSGLAGKSGIDAQDVITEVEKFDIQSETRIQDDIRNMSNEELKRLAGIE